MGNRHGGEKPSKEAKEEKKKKKKEKKARKKGKKKLANGSDLDLDPESSHFSRADSESMVFHSAENLSPYLDASTRSEEGAACPGFPDNGHVLSSRDFHDGFSIEACLPADLAAVSSDFNTSCDAAVAKPGGDDVTSMTSGSYSTPLLSSPDVRRGIPRSPLLAPRQKDSFLEPIPPIPSDFSSNTCSSASYQEDLSSAGTGRSSSRASSSTVDTNAAHCIERLEELERNIERTFIEKFADFDKNTYSPPSSSDEAATSPGGGKDKFGYKWGSPLLHKKQREGERSREGSMTPKGVGPGGAASQSAENSPAPVRKISEPCRPFFNKEGSSTPKGIIQGMWSQSAENSPVIVRKALPRPESPIILRRTPSQSPTVHRKFPANAPSAENSGAVVMRRGGDTSSPSLSPSIQRRGPAATSPGQDSSSPRFPRKGCEFVDGSGAVSKKSPVPPPVPPKPSTSKTLTSPEFARRVQNMPKSPVMPRKVYAFQEQQHQAAKDGGRHGFSPDPLLDRGRRENQMPPRSPSRSPEVRHRVAVRKTPSSSPSPKIGRKLMPLEDRAPPPPAPQPQSPPTPIQFCKQEKGIPVKTCILETHPSTAVVLATSASQESLETSRSGAGDLQNHTSKDPLHTYEQTVPQESTTDDRGAKGAGQQSTPGHSQGSGGSHTVVGGVDEASAEKASVSEDTIKQSTATAVFGSVSPKLKRHKKISIADVDRRKGSLDSQRTDSFDNSSTSRSPPCSPPTRRGGQQQDKAGGLTHHTAFPEGSSPDDAFWAPGTSPPFPLYAKIDKDQAQAQEKSTPPSRRKFMEGATVHDDEGDAGEQRLTHVSQKIMRLVPAREGGGAFTGATTVSRNVAAGKAENAGEEATGTARFGERVRACGAGGGKESPAPERVVPPSALLDTASRSSCSNASKSSLGQRIRDVIQAESTTFREVFTAELSSSSFERDDSETAYTAASDDNDSVFGHSSRGSHRSPKDAAVAPLHSHQRHGNFRSRDDEDFSLESNRQHLSSNTSGGDSSSCSAGSPRVKRAVKPAVTRGEGPTTRTRGGRPGGGGGGSGVDPRDVTKALHHHHRHQQEQQQQQQYPSSVFQCDIIPDDRGGSGGGGGDGRSCVDGGHHEHTVNLCADSGAAIRRIDIDVSVTLPSQAASCQESKGIHGTIATSTTNNNAPAGGAGGRGGNGASPGAGGVGKSIQRGDVGQVPGMMDTTTTLDPHCPHSDCPLGPVAHSDEGTGPSAVSTTPAAAVPAIASAADKRTIDAANVEAKARGGGEEEKEREEEGASTARQIIKTAGKKGSEQHQHHEGVAMETDASITTAPTPSPAPVPTSASSSQAAVTVLAKEGGKNVVEERTTGDNSQVHSGRVPSPPSSSLPPLAGSASLPTHAAQETGDARQEGEKMDTGKGEKEEEGEVKEIKKTAQCSLASQTVVSASKDSPRSKTGDNKATNTESAAVATASTATDPPPAVEDSRGDILSDKSIQKTTNAETATTPPKPKESSQQQSEETPTPQEHVPPPSPTAMDVLAEEDEEEEERDEDVKGDEEEEDADGLVKAHRYTDISSKISQEMKTFGENVVRRLSSLLDSQQSESDSCLEEARTDLLKMKQKTADVPADVDVVKTDSPVSAHEQQALSSEPAPPKPPSTCLGTGEQIASRDAEGTFPPNAAGVHISREEKLSERPGQEYVLCQPEITASAAEMGPVLHEELNTFSAADLPGERLVTSDTTETLSTDQETSASSKRESTTSTATDETLTSFKTRSNTDSAEFEEAFTLPESLVFVRSSNEEPCRHDPVGPVVECGRIVKRPSIPAELTTTKPPGSAAAGAASPEHQASHVKPRKKRRRQLPSYDAGARADVTEPVPKRGSKQIRDVIDAYFDESSEESSSSDFTSSTDDIIREGPIQPAIFTRTEHRPVPKPASLSHEGHATGRKIPKRPADGEPATDSSDDENSEDLLRDRRSGSSSPSSRDSGSFRIPEIEETFGELMGVKTFLEDMEDKTPTAEPPPFVETEDVKSKVFWSAGQYRRRSKTSPARTDRTESDLDVSEQRDDASTDSMYADDEDEGGELLFKRSYSEEQGGEVLLSCTIYNSSHDNDGDSDEFWADAEAGEAAAEENYKSLEASADAAGSAFQNARIQMHDIHQHLQDLRRQMELLQDDITSTSLTLTPDFSFESEQRPVTE